MKWEFSVEGKDHSELKKEVSERLNTILKEREATIKELEDIHVEALEAANRILSKNRIPKLVELTVKKLNRSYATCLDLPLGEGTGRGSHYHINFIGAGPLAIFEFRLDDVHGFFTDIHRARMEAEKAIKEAVEEYISGRDDLTEYEIRRIRSLEETYFLRFRVVTDALESSLK